MPRGLPGALHSSPRRRAAGLALAAASAIAAQQWSAPSAGAGEPPSALASLAGRHVEIHGSAADLARPEVRGLAADLDAAAAEIAARLPVALDEPIRVRIEADYSAQAHRLGRVGEAVPGSAAAGGAGAPGAGADPGRERGHHLHLVVAGGGADDLHAYRFALARELLGRARLAEGLPPWLARGAALWLSRQWYGRPYRAWLPDLAAAGALPSPEELLAAEVQPASSAPLWTPVAAAVLDGIPGETLAAKLASKAAREGLAAEVAAALGRIAAEARKAAPPAPGPLPRWDGAFLRGVSFAMLNHLDYGYHAPSVDVELARLAELGADAVSIMPFAYQPGPDQPELRFLNRGARSETDVGCVHAARRAHARGFRVLWKPHLWISHESWPGEVAMKSEEDWRAWWRAYRLYVLHHAFLARWAGAELFAVGVELDRTLVRRREWEELIAGARRLYPGPLTYASNWYGGLEEAPFWDRLDLVAVDAYFPLADSPSASATDLAAGAARVAERLAAAARRFGKPVLLTEVGFSARRAAWMEPHREGGEYHEADQAAAYLALLGALEGKGWLAGLFVWKAMSGRPPGSTPRPDFRFLGREAERELRRFFQRGAAPGRRHACGARQHLGVDPRWQGTSSASRPTTTMPHAACCETVSWSSPCRRSASLASSTIPGCPGGPSGPASKRAG